MCHLLTGKFVLLFIVVYTIHTVHPQQTTKRDQYTDVESTAIDKFRPMVKKHLTMDFHRTDAYLLRWIRGNNFDLESAKEELQKFHKWRKENNIDAILDANEVVPPELAYIVEGFDKGGRPLVIHPFGKWNLRKYVISGKQKTVIRQYQRMYEAGIRKAFQLAESTGKDVDQIYVLTDIAGYNAREHTCLGCIPVSLNLAASFNSGVLPFAKNITLVNAPRIFQPVLSLARAIITKAAVRDYDSNKPAWQRALYKDVSREELPSFLQ